MRALHLLALAALLVACDERAPRPPIPPRDAGLDAGRPRRDAGVPIPCARDAECTSGVCRSYDDVMAIDRADLPLSCGAPDPAAGAPGAACHHRSECDRHLCTISGACVVPCVDDDDCAAGHVCREAWVVTSRDAMQPVSACTAFFALPDGVVAAGPVTGPEIPGMDATVDDTLDDLAPNALVAWRVPELEQHVFVHRVDSRAAPPETLWQPGTSAPAWGIGSDTLGEVTALRYPNGPNTPASPSGLTVALGTETTAPSERWILRRERPGTTLDVDAYLLGGRHWESPDGEMPEELGEAFEGVRALLAPHGITLGEVRVHDVRGFVRARFSIVESIVSTDLREIFRLSAGATRPSVHVFFVRFIEGALGVAAGIVGAQGTPGTGASGVAVAADPIPPELMAPVIVHEIGHFLGLFHTTEFNGLVREPLTDTPECEASRDDGDGVLIAEECEGAGADNIMFWQGSGDRISAQQAEVMQTAYVLR